jgi:Suppressor of fused protein (SUFU)
MESTESSDWFEKIWEYREEIIYPELFGELEGIYALSADIFLKTFGQETYDPRWLFYGVFVSPPSGKRNSWLYVTSGMSNPWDDESPNPSGLSGLGCEFVFETVEKADWAILHVQNIMAVELVALVGITDDEAQYARENDGEKLVELLTRAGAFPITDPARKSVIYT